jgi:hypothetical protein
MIPSFSPSEKEKAAFKAAFIVYLFEGFSSKIKI